MYHSFFTYCALCVWSLGCRGCPHSEVKGLFCHKRPSRMKGKKTSSKLVQNSSLLSRQTPQFRSQKHVNVRKMLEFGTFLWSQCAFRFHCSCPGDLSSWPIESRVPFSKSPLNLCGPAEPYAPWWIRHRVLRELRCVPVFKRRAGNENGQVLEVRLDQDS